MDTAKLYAAGAVRLQGSRPADLGMPSATAAFLEDPGLPLFDPDKPLLGLRFESAQRLLTQGGRRFLVIGRETWQDDLLIGIDLADGEVHAISSQAAKTALFINTSVALFVEFLAEMQVYLGAASRDVPAPVTMSAEQARARLEAFRRGEIKPAQPVQRFDREKALARLAETFRQLDARSLDTGNWWSRVVEQARDGLI